MMLKTLFNLLAAAIVASIIISLVSSQLIVAEVQAFGLEVSFNERLSVTLKDLIGLGPALMLLTGLSFLVAFLIAHYCLKLIGGNRNIWYLCAGFTSFPVTLLLIQYFMGVTLLASARNDTGMFLVACCCMAGSWVFLRLNFKSGQHQK